MRFTLAGEEYEISFFEKRFASIVRRRICQRKVPQVKFLPGSTRSLVLARYFVLRNCIEIYVNHCLVYYAYAWGCHEGVELLKDKLKDGLVSVLIHELKHWKDINQWIIWCITIFTFLGVIIGLFMLGVRSLLILMFGLFGLIIALIGLIIALNGGFFLFLEKAAAEFEYQMEGSELFYELRECIKIVKVG